MDSRPSLPGCPCASPGLPGPSLALSPRALPNHPGRSRGCACSLLPPRCQASASSEAGPPPLVSRGRIGFACAGLAASLARRPPATRPALVCRTDPLRAVGHPQAPGRSYMSNEQFTWPTPLSRLERVGLPWRTEGTKRTADACPTKSSSAEVTPWHDKSVTTEDA